MRGRRKGGLHAILIEAPADEAGLDAQILRFLARLKVRAYSASGIEAHRWALRQFLGWAKIRGFASPSNFTRPLLEEYQLFLFNFRSARTQQPLVINTQIARLGAVRRFFAWLCREGVLPANPAADLDLPRKQARNLPKALSSEEIDRLLALPNLSSPFGLRDRTILELFYATGVRRSEMANLDFGDYDPSLQTLLVRRGKGGKSRMLPVGAHAAHWLDRYLAEVRPQIAFLPAETALFLSGYGTRITPAYLGNWVARQMKKAGIRIPSACHALRHSCASHMHQGGADIRYVQESSGARWTGAQRRARRERAAASIKCSDMPDWKPLRSIPTSTFRRCRKSMPAAIRTAPCTSLRLSHFRLPFTPRVR